MTLLLLLACTDPELGDCPPNPGEDLKVERVYGGSSEDLGDVARENEVEVFHDDESLDAWWQSGNVDTLSGAIDFSTSQAVGLVTYYAGEENEGYEVDGAQWADEGEDAIVFRIDYDCPYQVEALYSYYWEVWVTPILPASACNLEERCD